MIKNATFLFLYLIVGVANAQTTPGVQAYGEVNRADLELKQCDFEKEANAEVLFDYCTTSFSGIGLVIEHHKRYKIFNVDAGTELGNVALEIPTNEAIGFIANLRAETFNLNNDKIEVSVVDRKSFYEQKVDRWTSRITFSFPSLKKGSVFEYAYKETINYVYEVPDWYFQGEFPVRYSECDLKLPVGYKYPHKLYSKQELTINTDTEVAMENVPSLGEEPFMDSYFWSLQHVSFIDNSHGRSEKAIGKNDSKSWQNMGAALIFRDNYGEQLKNKLSHEGVIIDAVKGMSTAQKLAYIFNKVKDTLIREGRYDWNYNDNIAKVWKRKKGTASQINMILCRLLDQAGVDASLLVVSSDADRRVMPDEPSFDYLDEAVVHVKINDEKYYVLDASEKKSQWNQIPYKLLNTYGLYLNTRTPAAGLIFIEDRSKAKNEVFISADIMANGKMNGTVQISYAGYNRIRTIKKYKNESEEKFIDDLREQDNNIKISSSKIENMEVDTLPLIQNINFTLELPGAGENYTYLNPKLFASLKTNPFTSPARNANINLGFRNNYSINGRYKIPAGFRIESLPKNVTMLMPDSSIKFKQIAAEEDGSVIIHYSIDYNRSYFKKEEYPALYDFFKKMYEMLNEQIILKKT